MQVQIDAISAALRDAHGHGLTLKQLAGQLRLGHGGRQPLRRALRQLLGQGQATFDGHRYRFLPTPEGNGSRPGGGNDGRSRKHAAMHEPQTGSRRPQAVSRTASRCSPRYSTLRTR